MDIKYIDVNKLLTKIVELKKELPNTIEHLNDEESGFARGQQYELTAIEAEILCLQQEQPKFVKEIWHKVSEEANLTRPVVLSDGDKYMSPPCTFPFKDMSGFVKAMNKKYKANYTIWAYMNDLLNMSSIQQEQPVLPDIEDLEDEITAYIERHFHIRYDETLEVGNDPLTTHDFQEIARHFAEWGATHFKK